jgi:hypothetical protein
MSVEAIRRKIDPRRREASLRDHVVRSPPPRLNSGDEDGESGEPRWKALLQASSNSATALRSARRSNGAPFTRWGT